jgi:hypothetical protein
MPREVTVLHYKFEELSDDAKKRAIRKTQESIHSDFQYEAESITEMFNYTLKERGLPHGPLPGESRGKTRYARDETGTVEWSLSCCQGDGVAFYGPIDIDVAAPLVFKGAAYDEFVRVRSAIQKHGCDMRFRLMRNAFGTHYSHSRTMYVDGSTDLGMTDETTAENELGDRAGNLFNMRNYVERCAEAFCEFARSVSVELESKGYAAIDDYTSEEAAKDTILANEYEFDEDGDMV